MYKFYLIDSSGSSESRITFSYVIPISGSDDQDTKTDDGGKYDDEIEPTDTISPVDADDNSNNNENNSNKTLSIIEVVIIFVYKKKKNKDLGEAPQSPILILNPHINNCIIIFKISLI